MFVCCSLSASPPSYLSLLTARAWCQVAQKFTGGIGNKLCGECLCAGEGGGQGQVPGGLRGKATFSAPHPQQRSRDKRERGSPAAGRWLTEVRAPCPCPALLYGDAEKPAESSGSEPPRATSRKAACSCNQKPCSCPKADINYAFLHATGKGAPRGPGEPLAFALPRPPRPRGARTRSRTPGIGGRGRRRTLRASSAESEARPACPASAWRWAPWFQAGPRGRAL